MEQASSSSGLVNEITALHLRSAMGQLNEVLINTTSRPESNMLNFFPKMLPGVSQNFHQLYIFCQCSHYACIMLLG